MVNSKKNTKSIIALVVLSLLLIASICLAATGAWFTSKVEKDPKDLAFGTIAISSTGETSVTATSKSGTTDLLMPGDTLKISYSVKNDGENAYVVAVVKVEATAAAGKELTATEKAALEGLSGTYAATGNAKADACVVITKGATEATWKHSVDVDGKAFGNQFQGATVKVTVTILAIQEENLTAQEAYSLLTDAASKLNIDTGVESNA